MMTEQQLQEIDYKGMTVVTFPLWGPIALGLLVIRCIGWCMTWAGRAWSNWETRALEAMQQRDADSRLVNDFHNEVLEKLEAALTEARRVLRLVMRDYPCTSSSCHRCVATRAAVTAVLAQEEPSETQPAPLDAPDAPVNPASTIRGTA